MGASKQFVESRWTLTTSSGGDVSFSPDLLGVGATRLILYLGADGATRKLVFHGLGAGIGSAFLKFGISYADADWPSFGGKVFAGPGAGQADSLTPDTLCGPAVLFSFASTGFSYSRFGFGPLALTARASILGLDVGPPSIGVTGYKGWVTRDA